MTICNAILPCTRIGQPVGAVPKPEAHRKARPFLIACARAPRKSRQPLKLISVVATRGEPVAAFFVWPDTTRQGTMGQTVHHLPIHFRAAIVLTFLPRCSLSNPQQAQRSAQTTQTAQTVRRMLRKPTILSPEANYTVLL